MSHGDHCSICRTIEAELNAERERHHATAGRLREVTSLTGELTPEVWDRLSRAQGYIRCNENFCITPRDARETP